ncbi:MFS family permease [Chitinivorax tropicus]|uniref:MFS family permease n=1 Tax=Chitinivorax tropicus TaxID=714531 RepID=A0A840MEH5_9PROT|nr:MFS transporter [Chitinivorax tropicus]MBB5017674.1 MFS family permease [Chitinivorax tropicus]
MQQSSHGMTDLDNSSTQPAPAPATVPIRRSQWAVAALFLALGFNVGTWASRIPDLKVGLGLGAAQVGTLLLASGLGAICAFPLISILLLRLGSRRLCVLAVSLLPVVLVGMAWAPNYPAALLVMFAEGVLCALVNTSMNGQGVVVERVGGQAILSRLHAVFSLGLMCAAVFASGLSHLTTNLWGHFIAASLIITGLLCYASPGLLSDQPTASQGHNTKRNWSDVTTLWLGCALFFGTIAEGSMTEWSALYLREIVGASVNQAPLGIAAVSTSMLVARLFADSWRARWGDKWLVVVGGVVAFTGLALALALGGLIPALLGFSLVGAGVAAISPCIYSAAARLSPITLATVTTIGSVGSLMGPPVIGLVAQWSDLRGGMMVIAIAALWVSICALRIRWV